MAQLFAWACKPAPAPAPTTATATAPTAEYPIINTPPEPSAPELDSTTIYPKLNNNNNNRPTIRALSAAELELLQAENSKLREALQQLTQQLKGIKSTSADNSTGTNSELSGVQDFYSQLRASLEQSNTASNNPTLAAISFTGTDSNSTAEGQSTSTNIDHQPRLIRMPDTVMLTSPATTATASTAQSTDNEVAIVDLADIEWYVMVPGPNDSNSTIDEFTDNDTVVDPLDDEFVLIQKSDYTSALAEFLSQSIAARHPEAATLTPAQLRAMLDGTLNELKPIGTLGQAWQWGKLLYTTYGWASTAVNIYRQPAMIRLVASGAFKAATWILVLLV